MKLHGGRITEPAGVANQFEQESKRRVPGIGETVRLSTVFISTYMSHLYANEMRRMSQSSPCLSYKEMM
jgi:hypothetical protein